jgi:hypothetical protein
MRTLFLSALLLTGCASMLPTQTVNGVAVYVRDWPTVDTYCRPRVRPDNLGEAMYGCYISAENTIMVIPSNPAVLYHEVKHSQGSNHRGPRHSTPDHLDGLKPDGSPCEWYR